MNKIKNFIKNKTLLIIDLFKKSTHKWYIVTIVLLALLVTILFLLNKNNKKTIFNLKGENKFLTQKVDSFRNKTNILIYEQEIAKVYNDDLIKEYTNEIFNLKKREERMIKAINSYISVSQKVVIDSVYIPYTDTIYLASDSAKYNKYFRHLTDHYLIAGYNREDNKGILLDTINMFNTLHIRDVEKRRGVFKPTETVIQAYNTNPYFYNTEMSSIKVVHQPNEWNKWIKPTLAAIIAAGITYKITK